MPVAGAAQRGDRAVRVRGIRALVLDVDGVLTDGTVTYTGDGTELKTFHVRDGLGLVLAKRCGLKTAFLTGRRSEIVARRGRELGVDRVLQGIEDKGPVLEEVVREFGLDCRAVAYIGDDLNDLGAMARCGLSFTVPGAPEEVRREADRITRTPGGRGAVREVVEYVLRGRGLWEEAVAAFNES